MTGAALCLCLSPRGCDGAVSLNLREEQGPVSGCQSHSGSAGGRSVAVSRPRGCDRAGPGHASHGGGVPRRAGGRPPSPPPSHRLADRAASHGSPRGDWPGEPSVRQKGGAWRVSGGQQPGGCRWSRQKMAAAGRAGP